jgi:hypothetical protein
MKDVLVKFDRPLRHEISFNPALLEWIIRSLLLNELSSV